LTAKQNYRGTLGVLVEYLQSFDPRLVGLTGTPVQIAAAAKAVQIRIGLRLLALLGPATCPL
jgi:cytochrome oxidase Cu insertion factor (SCO1/SenC/PrrC family)